jgi:DHA2 family multidrug resistance protein
MAGPSNPGAPAPLAGAQLGLVAFALALGTFMQVLDSTIANVSLPTIAGSLGVSNDNSTWVITAFAVANGAAVPMTGWLMGRFGIVRTFCASVVMFTVASFLCGIAWNLSSLVFFRVLQGACSGPMIPGSQALLMMVFPPEKRSNALGIWSATTLVGPICGPLLGGYISDHYHWGWIFLINVPIGLFVATICWRGLATRETPTRKLPIDRTGIALLFLWTGCMQVMLDLGKDRDWFHSTLIVVLALIALVGFAAWLIWELTEAHPLVDLSLFRYRNFAVGTSTFCIAYAVMFASLLVLPLWLQTQLGYTATWAGWVAAPSGMVAVLVTPFVARLTNKMDIRILASIAMIAFAASYKMRAEFTPDVASWNIIASALVQGFGMGMFFLAMNTIALDGIPFERIPAASGLLNFGRITAGSFAASLATTVWDRRETVHQSRLAEAVGNGPALQNAMAALQQHGMSAQQAAGAITRQIVGQSYVLATTDIFYASAWVSAIIIFTLWLTRRPKPMSGPIAAD